MSMNESEAGVQTDIEDAVKAAEADQADEDSNDETESESDTDTDMSNDARYNEMIKSVKRFGREAAAGADSLPKLGLTVLRARKDEIIAADDKKAVGTIYDIYVEQRNKKRVHVQTKEGRAAQVSKLNKFKDLGGVTLFDGEELMDRAVRLYHEAQAAQTKMISVYAAYVNVARMATEAASDKDNPHEPTDEEIMAVMLPKEKESKTTADVVQDIAEQLEKLMTGERKDGVTCQDQAIIDAHGKLAEWLAAFTLASETAAFYAQAAKLGIKV